MAYNSTKHGIADYNSWMQLPNDFTPPEGDESVPYQEQAFANLVYVVNPSGGGGIGDVVGLSGNGTVKTVADALKVHVVNSSSSTVNYDTLSRIILEDSGNTYIGHAAIGSTTADSVWQVQKIDATGSKQWADGGAFTQVATDFTVLTYNY